MLSLIVSAVYTVFPVLTKMFRSQTIKKLARPQLNKQALQLKYFNQKKMSFLKCMSHTKLKMLPKLLQGLAIELMSAINTSPKEELLTTELVPTLVSSDANINTALEQQTPTHMDSLPMSLNSD